MKDPFERELAVFSTARRLPPAERVPYLDQTCTGDLTLRQRVEELLRAGEDAEEFLQEPAPGAQRPEATPSAPTLALNPGAPGEKAGDRIGRYKLLQQIGEGGCGLVYMAEQEEPVRRRVALKVIKLGMDTKSVIARFEAERQALAMMDHANIAKVLDAGATETGRPYFVMELVRGIKITDYCDEHNLSTKERLELFIQVCHAVQHAHQKGIIHRDLKPSNILVASDDGVPVPKVIDFGIAKATQGRLTDQTLFTAFEQFIGTPAYMSPEQAELTMQDVDTRTDIYSLGVLLYELLTGKTPFEAQQLLASGLDAMRRTIREQEPERPSTKLSTMLKGELTTTARHRHTEAVKLIHQLRGDLDWIVMKALEKDRARRYQTANGFARDVERYLADEPVAARPPSKLYRFLKLARRNQLAFAAGGAVAVALVIGLAATTWEYLKERKARQRETAVNVLLQQLLNSTDPEGLRGPGYTVRQLLDDFSSVLTNQPQLATQPEVEATVRLAIGWAYYKRGVLSEAEHNLRQAVELRGRALGLAHPDTIEAKDALASLLAGGWRRWEEAGKLSFETWQARLRLLGPENTNTLTSAHTYVGALMESGRSQEAERVERQVLQIRQRILPPDHPDTIQSLGTLGQILTSLGEHRQAEAYDREALAAYQRTGYGDKLDGVICAKEIALCRLRQGDPLEAVNSLQEISRLAVTNLGPDHYATLLVQRVLARALVEIGQLDRAETLCKETLELRSHSKAKEEGYGTARTQLTLGSVLVQQGKLDEAEPVLEEALKFFRQDSVRQSRPELAAQAANWLGAIHLEHKDYTNTEPLLLEGCEHFFAPGSDMTPHERGLAVGHIVQLYQVWAKPEQAAYWQKKLDSLAPPTSKP
jgi:serine/threonine protein kinase